MDAKVLASQKHEERLAAFWPRKVSRHFTNVLVKMPVTANQVTVLWGIISALNSYTVYLALTGRRELIPLIPLVYMFCVVLDSVDGEIARYKNMANPVAGKLLDGICHRATEFSLLVAYAAAAYALTGSPLAVYVGLLLLTGDAMFIYVYERRLTILRQQVGFKGHVKLSDARVYKRGTPWSALTSEQQMLTIAGLFNYKSVYAVITLSFLPSALFLTGLAVVALYKHRKWIGLLRRALRESGHLGASDATTTLNPRPEPQAERATAAAESVVL